MKEHLKMKYNQLEYGSAKKKMWLSGITASIFCLIEVWMIYTLFFIIEGAAKLPDIKFTNKTLFVLLMMCYFILLGIKINYKIFVEYWLTEFGKNVTQYRKEKKQEAELDERIDEKSV